MLILWQLIIFLWWIKTDYVFSMNEWSKNEINDILKTLQKIEKKQGVFHYKVCETDDCIMNAYFITQSINNEIDPCVNFYRFVCTGHRNIGQYPQLNTLKFEKERKNIIQTKMLELLSSPENGNNIRPVKMAKQMFRECLDDVWMGKYGLDEALDFLTEIVDFPLISSNPDIHLDKSHWEQIEMRNQLYGIPGLFIISPLRYYHKLSVHAIKIDHRVEMPVNKIVKQKSFNATKLGISYLSLIKNVIQSIQMRKARTISETRILSDIEGMISFESKLFEISQLPFDKIDSPRGTFIKVNRILSQIKNVDADKLNIWRFINNAFTDSEYKVPIDKGIYVSNVNAFGRLAQLISTTPVRHIVNYLQWKMASRILMYADPYLHTQFMNFVFMSEHKTTYPRSQFCLNHMVMKNAISYQFANEFISPEIYAHGHLITENIKNVLIRLIPQVDWMSKDMQQKIIEKIHTMTIFIGQSDSFAKTELVLKYYEELDLDSNPVRNLLKVLRHEQKQIMHLYVTQANEDPWPANVYSFDYNTMSIPASNAIMIPASFFLTNYFSKDLPLSVLYGLIGSAISHELAHQMTLEQINLNRHGVEVNWDPKDFSLASYTNRMNCFITQYNHYPEISSGKYVNGEITLNENIADNVGRLLMEIAFFKNFLPLKNVNNYAEYGVSIKLPGLEQYTEEQLLYIAYAHNFCESTDHSRHLGYHSPNHARIIGSIANSKLFTKVFNCPRNAATVMNPKVKCDL